MVRYGLWTALGPGMWNSTALEVKESSKIKAKIARHPEVDLVDF